MSVRSVRAPRGRFALFFNRFPLLLRRAGLGRWERLVGAEWLVVGTGMSWDDLARDVGVSVTEIRDLKKTANVETGVRHAAKTGIKMRASSDNYGSWVCGLVDAINATRARLESGFVKMTAEQVGHAVARAIPAVPYG